MTSDPAPHQPGEAKYCAVIGAGVAGLSCARALQREGWQVVVFERAREVGGRLRGHLTDAGHCDIGAQFLTLQDADFAEEVRRWAAAHRLASWEPEMAELNNGIALRAERGPTRYVGVPSMQALGNFLAEGLEVILQTEVLRLVEEGGRWQLLGREAVPLDSRRFHAVALAMPSPECMGLVAGHSALVDRLERVRWDACWAACLTLSRPSGIEFDAAFIQDDPILAWVARENSKPGRVVAPAGAERWLLQARPSWSNRFPGLLPDEAARWMQRAFAARMGRALSQKACEAMRWTLGTPVDVVGEACLWDPAMRLGVAGDWLLGARIDAAYLSGTALARSIAGAATAPQ